MTPKIINNNAVTELAQLNDKKPKIELMWINIIVLTYIHIAAFYGFYLVFTSAKLLTTLYAFLLFWLGQFGAIVGTHRYWSHRAFQATLPLKLILFITSTMTFMGPIINWARDHRCHHKFSDSNADPVNPVRGLFFTHIGWLLVKRHSDVNEKGKLIDNTDLTGDSLLRFQKKYYFIIAISIAFLLPALLPMYLWNETFVNAWFIPGVLRICVGLNTIFLINSLGHSRGTRPYTKRSSAVQNLLCNILTIGEGWHNFHHAFPRDYRHGEFGEFLPSLTQFIDLFAKIGWAYDLKTTPQTLIKQTKLNILEKQNFH